MGSLLSTLLNMTSIMKNVFLISDLLHVNLQMTACAPLNDEENGSSTIRSIEVNTLVPPTKSLCDLSEDTVASSLYNFLRSIFKVGRSAGTLVTAAEKILGYEQDHSQIAPKQQILHHFYHNDTGDFLVKDSLVGDGIQDDVNSFEKTVVNDILPSQVNNLKDLVNDINDIVEAYLEYETKRSKDTFKTFEEKYDAIVKKYNDAEPGLYDPPVPANIWWYSWLPPRYYFNKYIEQAPAAEKKLKEVKDQVNRTLSSIAEQFNGLSSK